MNSEETSNKKILIALLYQRQKKRKRMPGLTKEFLPNRWFQPDTNQPEQNILA
jgi:hypothetical protein